jgi:hypothetical protein
LTRVAATSENRAVAAASTPGTRFADARPAKNLGATARLVDPTVELRSPRGLFADRERVGHRVRVRDGRLLEHHASLSAPDGGIGSRRMLCPGGRSLH